MLRWRAIATWSTRAHQTSTTRRWLHGDSGHPTRPSRHAQFYSDLVPAMIPVALLGSAVYMVREACAQVENAFRIRADLTYFANFAIGSSRVYSCCRHTYHMKNTLTRPVHASRNLNRVSMLCYSREGTPPHPHLHQQLAPGTPQL
jgi:hypothetical protein